MRKQFWIDLISTLISIHLLEYFKEDKAGQYGLVLRFIVVFGLFCTYRIMSFIDKCDEAKK